MKMSMKFQIVDLSQCHTTVITVRTSGCSAKVRKLEYSERAIAHHQKLLILVSGIIYSVPRLSVSKTQKSIVRVIAMNTMV